MGFVGVLDQDRDPDLSFNWTEKEKMILILGRVLADRAGRRLLLAPNPAPKCSGCDLSLNGTPPDSSGLVGDVCLPELRPLCLGAIAVVFGRGRLDEKAKLF